MDSSSNFFYLNSNSLPTYYKVGFSDHKHSFPCVGDVIFGWEAKTSSNIPKITLNTSGAPSVTLNSFGGSIYSIIDYAPASKPHLVQAYRNSSASAKINSTDTPDGNYLAFIGITFPTTNLYTDKTNMSSLSIFNGGTAHISGINKNNCPNGVILYNTMLCRSNSTEASFSRGGNYFRETDGDMRFSSITINRKDTPFTTSSYGGTYHTHTNGVTYLASQLVEMWNNDYDVAAGNGFTVSFKKSTTIEILACYMSMKKL